MNRSKRLRCSYTTTTFVKQTHKIPKKEPATNMFQNDKRLRYVSEEQINKMVKQTTNIVNNRTNNRCLEEQPNNVLKPTTIL